MLCSIGTMLVTMPTVSDTDNINATLKPQYIPECNACLKDMPVSSGSSFCVVVSGLACCAGMRNHINDNGNVNSKGIAPNAMNPACQP
ncbi:hypothetical protein D3C73_1488630 [compost metagenome]